MFVSFSEQDIAKNTANPSNTCARLTECLSVPTVPYWGLIEQTLDIKWVQWTHWYVDNPVLFILFAIFVAAVSTFFAAHGL